MEEPDHLASLVVQPADIHSGVYANVHVKNDRMVLAGDCRRRKGRVVRQHKDAILRACFSARTSTLLR